MKRFLVLLFLLMYFFGYAQSKVRVIDETNQKPIPNAKISCDGKVLGFTDVLGVLEFKASCSTIEIQAEKYEKENASVEANMEVSLLKKASKTTDIEEVVIEDRSDPRAIEILKKVNRLFKENSPKSLNSYTFKSYEKVSLDIDQDSITQFNQFFNDTQFFKKKREKDSLNNISAKQIFQKANYSYGKEPRNFYIQNLW